MEVVTIGKEHSLNIETTWSMKMNQPPMKQATKKALTSGKSLFLIQAKQVEQTLKVGGHKMSHFHFGH